MEGATESPRDADCGVGGADAIALAAARQLRRRARFQFFFVIVRFGSMLREARQDLRARGQIMGPKASLERQVTR